MTRARPSRVRVGFTDDAGNEEGLISAPTETVSPKPNSSTTGAPTISGTTRVGETLTTSTSGIADADGLTNATFSYQWIRNDGTADTDIQDASSSTYTLAGDDQGKTVRVRVSLTDDAGHAETLVSAATATIAPPPLTADFHPDDTPKTHDGQASFTFELRFSEEFELSYKTLRDHAFGVTAGAIAKARRLNPPQQRGLGDHGGAELRRRRDGHPTCY